MSAQVPRVRQDEPHGSSVTTIPIEINGADYVYSVAFLAEGEHIVSGGCEGKIRRWRVEDGKEVGTPMDTGSPVYNIAVSQDEGWIVAGTKDGLVSVWNAKTHKKATQFTRHSDAVRAVDISKDGTRLLSGSSDRTARIWSFSAAAEQPPSPLRYDHWVIAAKFSPDGSLIATTVRERQSVRVYDSRGGNLLHEIPIQSRSFHNQSLAWTSDSEQLFALSIDGTVHCLHLSTGRTLSKWSVHNKDAQCIAIAGNGTFMAVSAGPSVSFWDTTTHEQIGFVTHPAFISSMAISSNCDLAIAGGDRITLHSLCDVLPASYWDNLGQNTRQKDRVIKHLRVQEQNLKRTIASLENTAEELRNQLAKSQLAVDALNEDIESLRANFQIQETNSRELERTVQQLRTANEAKDDVIRSLRAQVQSSGGNATHSGRTVEDLRSELAESQRTAKAQAEAIKSLHVNLLGQKAGSKYLERAIQQLQSSNREKDALISSLRTREQDLKYKAVDLEKTVAELRNQLAESQPRAGGPNEAVRAFRAVPTRKTSLGDFERTIRQLRTANQEKDDLIESLRTEKESLSGNTARLEKAIGELRNKFVESERKIDEQNEINRLLRVDLQTQRTNSVASQEKTLRDQLAVSNRERDGIVVQLSESQHRIDSLTRIIRAHEQRLRCEAFYAQDCILEAANSLIEMKSTLNEDTEANEVLLNWLSDFTQRSVTALERIGDQASNGNKPDEAIVAYASALTLSPSIPNSVLTKWTRATLARGSMGDTLDAAAKFKIPKSLVYRAIRDSLEETKGKASQDIYTHDEQWEFVFPARSTEKSEILGDASGGWENHEDDAVQSLSAASLRSTNTSDVFSRYSSEAQQENVAYHQFGIPSVSLPDMHGQDSQVVGRLLERTLARSSNVALLAWTGQSGVQHSYLPTNLTVYDPIAPPLIPVPVQVDSMVARLCSSLHNLSLPVALYELLHDLPSLSVTAGRLKLPGIVFPLTDSFALSEQDPDSYQRVYRATVPVLGEVKVKTTDDLSELDGLVLVHPWVGVLLDRDFSCGVPQFDLATRALRLLARLREPFGALLLAPSEPGVSLSPYRRVAADCLITVRVREEVDLSELMDGIRTVEVE